VNWVTANLPLAKDRTRCEPATARLHLRMPNFENSACLTLIAGVVSR